MTSLLSAADTARNAGFVIGRFIVLPILILAIYFVIVLLARRRRLTTREVTITLLVGLGIAVLSALAQSTA
ncbi:hypothetical protein D1871_02995 [Nakamurella silvestris]|nr:hypothetical protein D1871_02995 [Nakamurella silvestris]